VREVFDLFDFWDGRDGMVDGFKIGDFLRCCGLDPTQAMVMANGGTKQLGVYQSCGSRRRLTSVTTPVIQLADYVNVDTRRLVHNKLVCEPDHQSINARSFNDP
jgi:hypothetical protein